MNIILECWHDSPWISGIVVFMIVSGLLMWWCVRKAPMMPDWYDEIDSSYPPIYCSCDKSVVSDNVYKCDVCGSLVNPED